MTHIDEAILKQLTRQRYSEDIIGTIMRNLDTYDRKNRFFSYLQDNIGVIIPSNEILQEVYQIKKDLPVEC